VEAYGWFLNSLPGHRLAMEMTRRLLDAQFFGVEDLDAAIRTAQCLVDMPLSHPYRREAAELMLEGLGLVIKRQGEEGTIVIPDKIFDLRAGRTLARIEPKSTLPDSIRVVHSVPIPSIVRRWMNLAISFGPLAENSGSANALRYAAAKVLFRYGHFAAARRELRDLLAKNVDSVLKLYIQVDLIRMARLENNWESLEQLASEFELEEAQELLKSIRDSRLQSRLRRAARFIRQAEAIDENAGVRAEQEFIENRLGNRGGTGTTNEPTRARPSELRPHTFSLVDNQGREIPVRSSDFSVLIEGFRARVVMELKFKNAGKGVAEGQFKLRLPEGAAPYFLAFGKAGGGTSKKSTQKLAEEWNQVREAAFRPDVVPEVVSSVPGGPKTARVVPRAPASKAYTETVQRNVDPALLEWSATGVFAARVFPLQPGEIHRVVLGYDVDIPRLGNVLEYRLDLPDGVPVNRVSIGTAHLAGASLEVSPDGGEWRESEDAKFVHFTNPSQREIVVRQIEAGGPILLEQESKVGAGFFAVRVTPQLDFQERKILDTVVIAVDLSLSSGTQRDAIWYSLLKAILDSNRQQIRRFAVLFFHLDSFWWNTGFVENTPENVAKLLAFAGTLSVEGATDLRSAISRASAPEWAGEAEADRQWDLLVISDGNDTWNTQSGTLDGSLQPGERVGRVVAFRTGDLDRKGLAFLTGLASKSGGAVFAVTNSTQAQQAAEACSTLPWHLESAFIEGSKEIIARSQNTDLFPGMSLLLAGRGKVKEGAPLVLRFGGGGSTVEQRINLAQRVTSPSASRIFGSIAVELLEEGGAKLREHAVAFSRHFRVIRESCSLLMLESEADYARHGLVDTAEADAAVAASSVARLLQKPEEPSRDAGTEESTSTAWKSDFLAWISGKLKIGAGGVPSELPCPALWPCTQEESVHSGWWLTLFATALPASVFVPHVAPEGVSDQTGSSTPVNLALELSEGRIGRESALRCARERYLAGHRFEAVRCLSSLLENEGSILEKELVLVLGYLALGAGRSERVIPLLMQMVMEGTDRWKFYHLLLASLEADSTPMLLLLWTEAVHGLVLRNRWCPLMAHHWSQSRRGFLARLAAAPEGGAASGIARSLLTEKGGRFPRMSASITSPSWVDGVKLVVSGPPAPDESQQNDGAFAETVIARSGKYRFSAEWKGKDWKWPMLTPFMLTVTVHDLVNPQVVRRVFYMKWPDRATDIITLEL
jgi:hypothetical protein